MNMTNRIVGGVAIVVLTGASWAVPAWSAETSRAPDVMKGETSQQKSQQGIGLEGGGSSNVILGGPEIIFGKIAGIQGDEFMIEGDRGQFIRLRATKDTNMVCNEGQGAKLSSSRQGVKERSEIPISPATEEEMKNRALTPEQERAVLNDPNKVQAENQQGAPTKDPSTLKDVVGSTDANANKDAARGSGFVIGGSSGCQFKAGDMVRVEASDMGTATTIQELSAGERARIAGRESDQPQQ